MAQIHHFHYIRSIALSIKTFRAGDKPKSLQIISQADLDLESALNSSNKPQNSFNVWVKKTFVKVESPKKGLDAEYWLEEVFALYKDDRFGEAITLLESLKAELHPDHFNHPIIEELESDYREIKAIFEGINDTTGWNVEDSGKISVKYKNVPGTPTYTLLTEAEIDVPAFNFITLMYETDLYHTWIPFCKKSTTVAKLSRTRKILWQEYSVPLIATRQTCMHGFGANLLSTHGVIIICSKSCDQDTHFKGVKLPNHSTSSRAVVNMLGCIIKPLSYNRIKATLLTNFDPAIRLVPYKILNYFSRKMAKGIFQKAVKKAKDFEGSEYQKRMKMEENREFYEFLEKSHREYLDPILEMNK